MESANNQKSNPFDEASVFSRLFFVWPAALLKKGAESQLGENDIPIVSKYDKAEVLLNRLYNNWQNQDKTVSHPLLRAVFKSFVPYYGDVGIYLLLETPVRIFQAILLGYLVDYFYGNTGSSYGVYRNGYTLSALLVSTSFVVFMLHHHAFFWGFRFGLQLRVALSNMIYNKAIRLHLRSFSNISTGKIVSMVSQDVEILQQAGLYFHYIYVPILEAGVILYFGIWLLGLSFLAGFAIILLLVPLQIVFSRLIASNRRQTAHYSDDRIKLVNQMLMGVRIMKMNGWEIAFNSIISKVRELEVASLIRTNYLKALNEAIFFCAPSIVACIVWVVYVKSGGHITPSKLFTVLCYLVCVQYNFTKFFTMAVQFSSEAWISLERIENFLMLEEVNSSSSEKVLTFNDSGEVLNKNDISVDGIELAELTELKESNDAIICRNFTASWGVANCSSEVVNTLRNLNFTVKTGELIAVVGAVGSSKTSLLMAILGELSMISSCNGFLKIKRSLSTSFCAQEPWIMSNTVRNNILFGRPFDESWYKTVVTSCALLEDFRMLSHGDMTIIGDRGVNLSGGQRARVGLARAVYGRCQLNLLDDPLSAVDPNIGNHLFNIAICGEALKESTRILVTHQTQYLSSPEVSRIMVLEGGEIIAFDTFSKLQESGVLAHLLHDLEDNSETDTSITQFDTKKINNISTDVSVPPQETEEPKNVSEGITVKEDQAIGDITWGTYWSYFQYVGSNSVLIILLILLMFGQVSVVAVNIWLARWSNYSPDKQQSPFYINIYIILVAISIIASIARALACYQCTTFASLKMHDSMLSAVIRAPILFFDSNPVGRVLNRFAKDIGFTDNQLPEVMFDFTQLVFMVLAAIVVVGIGVYYVFIAIVPLAIGFYFIRSYYMKTSREVKRIEATTRSPVFSHLSETLDGLVTIRAFNSTPNFLETFQEVTDKNTAAYFAFMASARWLGFRLDVLTLLLFIVSTFGSVAAKQYHADISPTFLAVGIMYVIQLTGMFQWAVRQSAEVENLMISVERVLSYAKTEPEAPLYAKDMDPKRAREPPKDWPTQGKIVAKDLVCTYRKDLSPVIKGISFEILPGQRVGVVGRTGAGKSSLMSVLLRLIDIQAGALSIDNVNIENIGLHELRPRISVIPQVPFLFLGTVRQNLDMFQRHTDAEIWQAIDSLHLRSVVSSKMGDSGKNGEIKPSGSVLDAMIAENGSNFSVGERQLLCLCRSILQKNKILIMDEATANVDIETDKEIQQAIRREFSHSTVLMIAHRLQTVIDCDVVLVLSQGKLVECGHPYKLLNEKKVVETGQVDVSFAGMVRDTGPQMAQQLYEAAREAYRIKNPN